MQLLQDVFAQGAGGAVNTVVQDFGLTGRFGSLAAIFGFITNLIIGVGWSLVFIMVALGFVQYVMSKGEKVAVQGAQQWLTYAIIGGVGLFFVMVIKNLILQILGASPVTSVGGNIAL